VLHLQIDFLLWLLGSFICTFLIFLATFDAINRKLKGRCSRC
jgi:hypothetical protein